MRTGEGKTLVATLAVYLNALPSKGVHVVTVNDYLARRDAEWMSKIYHFLGLSVGVIQSTGGQGPDDGSFIYDPAHDGSSDGYLHLDRRPGRKLTPVISPTVPTMSLVSITCATIWPSVPTSASSAINSLRWSMRLIQSLSMRHVPL